MLPLEKSTYLGRAVHVPGFAPSDKGGQIAVTFSIVSSVTDDEGRETFADSGETLTWFGSFSTTVMKNGTTVTDRTLDSLDYCGWRGDDVAELNGLEGDACTEKLPDVVELACDVDTYDPERPRLKVQWVNRRGGSRFVFEKPMTDDDLRSLSAQLKSKIRNRRGGAQQRPANGQRALPPSRTATKAVHPNAPGGGHDDDLPF